MVVSYVLVITLTYFVQVMQPQLKAMRYFDSLIPETCAYFDDRVIRYSNFLISYYVVLISRNNLIYYGHVSEVLDMSKNNLCYNQ